MKTILLLWLLAFQDADVIRAKALIEQLDHSELAMRESADRDLQRLARGNAAIDALIDEALKSDSPERRTRAQSVRRVRLAAKISPNPEKLLENLSSPQVDLRQWAAERIRKAGAAAAPLAAEIIREADPYVKRVAITILGQSGDARYAELVRPFLDDPQQGPIALESLVSMRDETIRPRLKEMALDRRIQRITPIQGLARIACIEDVPFFRDLLRSEEVNAVDWTLLALSRWPEARAALADEIHELALGGSTLALLLAADNPRPGLEAALLESCRRQANLSQASLALAALKNREAVPFLMQVARYDAQSEAGIRGLGLLAAPEAIPLFRRMLGLGDGYPDIQNRRPQPRPQLVAAMAWSLGEIGTREAEALLLEFLRDETENVRYEACLALGRMKSKRGAARMIPLLLDATATWRSPVPTDAKSLLTWFHFGPRQVTEMAQVREAASAALESMTGRATSGTMDERVKDWTEWWKSHKGEYPTE